MFMPGARTYRGAIVSLGLLAMFLSLATAASAVEPPLLSRSFGPDGTASTEFERPGPIAVDQTDHVVYVIDHDAGSLLKFDSNGNPVSFGGSSPNLTGNELSGLTYNSCAGCSQVAVDSTSHDFYVTSENSITAFHSDGEPAEFTAGPGAGTNKIGGFSELLGLAVDENGNIFASDYFGGVEIYSPTGEPITDFAAENPGNLAVDGRGVVYVNRWAGTVQKYQPSEPSVTPTTTYSTTGEAFDSSPSWTVAVDPATNDVYVARREPGEIAWFDEDGNLLATFPGIDDEGELASPEGVAIDGAEERIFASNSMGAAPRQVEIFGEDNSLDAPVVKKGPSVINVTADSATLRAVINPRRAETTYWFEYGRGDCSIPESACTSVPLGGESIGDGRKPVSVSQNIGDLLPDTTYHYRVVAENSQGDNLAEEGDHTFRTQPGGLGFELIDSRAWEMVSPPDKHGALLEGSLNAQIQAAADGEGLIYSSRGPVEEEPEGNRGVEASTILAKRSSNVWSSKEINLPNEKVTELPVGNGGEYKLFSQDLSMGLVEPRTPFPLSPETTEKTPHLRENTEPPVYTPLLTASNVTSGAKFGGNPDKAVDPDERVEVVAATPDLSKVVLRARAVPLVPDAPASAGDAGLYLWAAGQLQPINLLPAGEGGGFVAGRPQIGSGAASTRHAISDDGSLVFWSKDRPDESNNALYVRDVAGGVTGRIDDQSGAPPGTPFPVFQGASADGSVVFFSDSQQLTADASPSGRDLYRCELSLSSPAAGCTDLVNISAPLEGSGESAQMQGIAAGIGDDGSTVYFVAKGVLDTSPNEGGEVAKAGKFNLYVWEKGSGVRFIAILSIEDNNAWGNNRGLTDSLSSAASPGGRYLSFMSRRPLDGEDNLDAERGEPLQQVFRYDAVSDRLDCLSCSPSGAAPQGEEANLRRLVDPLHQWEGVLVGAVLPQLTMTGVQNPQLQAVSLYSPRAVLDNGRIFFNSFNPLVAADSNSEWDVYQYEPFGTGTCTEGTNDAATAQAAGGCVSLISSGTGEREVGFLDASESGDDVFFLTPSRLNEPDEDLELDVYDARVNGVPATRPKPVDCLGEACQPFVGPPIDPTPGSASFKGPGNVKPGKRCPKGKHKVRRKGKVRCVKHGKHKKQHKRSGDNRGVRR